MSGATFCFACQWKNHAGLARGAYLAGLANMLTSGVAGSRAYLCDECDAEFTTEVRKLGGVPGVDRTHCRRRESKDGTCTSARCHCDCDACATARAEVRARWGVEGGKVR